MSVFVAINQVIKLYKLKLIKPKYKVANVKIPPLSLLTLATLTPKDKFDIEIIDGSVERIKIKKADLVGITVSTIEAIDAYKIADKFRKKGAKVILGGIHVSFLPKEAIKHADSVVIGEAENVWEKVLDDFSRGKLKKFYRAKKFPDMSKPRIVDYKLLKNNKYLFPAVQTTRGCPFNCEFCSVVTFNGRKQRHKKIEDVIEQIRHIKKIRKKKKEIILLADDNLTVDKKYAKKLFRAMIPLNIRWFAQLPVDFADDDELLDLAYKSGLRLVVMGFESVNQKSLKNISKINIVREYGELINKLRKYRIIVWGLFVLGLEDDDKDIFKNTLNFCNKYNIPFAFFQILRPLPGTPIFKKMKKENRILTFDWCSYDKIVFKPKNIKINELKKGILDLHLDFYSLKNTFKNILNLIKMDLDIPHLLIFLAFYIYTYIKYKTLKLSGIFGFYNG